MKPLLTFLFLVGMLTGTVAQNLLYEDFSGSSFPPQGWTIDDHASNWSLSPTSQSWGTLPEARLGFEPDFGGSTRLISPPFDLTGVSKVILDFNFRLDNKEGGCMFGAATRHGSGPWNTVLAVDFHPYPDSYNGREEIEITNSDVNNPGFQFCLFLTVTTTGAHALTNWFIDNVHLFKQATHDVSLDGWNTYTWYNSDDSVQLYVPVRNRGL